MLATPSMAWWTLHTLQRGVHAVRLSVADGVGGEAVADVRIVIEPRR